MTASAYRFFRAPVADITSLTPSFRRFTFRGDDLSDYGDPGFDQRVKVVFPSERVGIDAMPGGPDWYTAWRELPEGRRPPFRTFTTRAVRNDVLEVVLDMVVHEVSGPASEWIERASVGDEVRIYAPTTAHAGVNYGVDFVPPAETGQFLLAGDETAAPAIAVILEQLPAEARGVVVVEEVDVDAGLLWEVPRTAKGGAALRSAPLYAWLAGEATGITALRRHLVTTVGIDRRAVAFMGYWRLGRSEGA